MLKKWLGFGLTTEQEDRYRQSRLLADLTQARIGIWLIVVPFVIFFFNDYQFFGLSGWFYGLTAGRLGLLVYTLWLLGFMRKIKDYRSYDKAEFLWGVTIVCFTMVVNITRPHFIGHVAVVIVSVFVTLLIIPNQFANQLILSLAFVIGETLIIALNLQTPVIQTAFSILLSLFLATAIGISSSWQLHSWRRREFLARGEEYRLLEELRRNREWLQVTLISIGDAVISTDTAGGITFLNPVAQALTGWPHKEAVGQPIETVFRIINEKTNEPTEDIVRQVLREGSVVTMANNTALINREGQVIPIEDSAAAILDVDNNVTGVVLVFHDVTEKRRAQIALVESEKRYRTLFETMTEAFALHEIICDGEGRPCDYRFLQVNPAFERMTGLKAADLVGRTLYEVLPQAESIWVERYGSVALTGQPVHFEQWTEALGRHYEVHAFQTERGYFGVVFLDVTERKRAVETIRKSEEKYRHIIEYSPTAIYEIDFNERRFKTVNEGMCRMVGYTEAELLSMNPMDLLDKESRQTFLDRIRQAQAGETPPDQIEYKAKRKDGSDLWGILQTKFKYANGKIVGAFVVAHDITERKQTEEALQESEQRFRSVLDNSLDCIYRLNLQTGCYEYISPSVEKVVGFSPEELMALDVETALAMIHPDDVPAMRAAIARLEKTGAVEAEYRQRTKNSDYRWISNHISLTRDSAGRPLYRDGTIRDITERKGMEEDLRKSRDVLGVRVGERTAELEQSNRELTLEIVERLKMEQALKESKEQLRILASQILSAQENERKRIALEVHDVLGSSLSAIKFKVEEALLHLPEKTLNISKPLETLIPLIQDTIEEVRRIQADLRPPLLDDLGIVATFSWFCRRFETIYSGIKVEQAVTILEEEVPDHLKIVLFRITQEAMNNIGKHAKADSVYLGLQKVNGAIELLIRDNGEGFDLESLSSRDSSKKGLGLSSMKERGEFSGGSFSIESAKGKGTVIRAVWPI